MTKFLAVLRDESAFKAAALAFSEACLSAKQNGRFVPERLHTFLLKIEGQWSSEDVFSGARALASFLNKYHDFPKLGRCQQALALVFAGCSFQQLMSYWQHDIFHLIDGLDLPKPARPKPGGITVHPYPPELHDVGFLAPFQQHWESCNASTHERAFLPPVPPAAVFGIETYQHYEVYRSWRPGARKPIINGQIGVLVKDHSGDVRGILRWSWWGVPLSGSDFALLAKDGDEWLAISMDIRPSVPSPICGPNIRRLDSRKFNGVCREIREIALPPNEDDDEE